MSNGKWVGSVLGACGLLVATACGGSTGNDSGTGGAGTGGSAAGGSGGSAAGGTGGSAAGGSGGSATGGSGGSATGGSGGSATGGAAGVGGDAGTCGPNAKTCAQTSECVLAAASCCICGTAELTDYVAVNKASESGCSCQGPACGCASMNNPNLGATCDTGSCSGFDVRQVDALSSCTSDSDCTLRMGLGCCEACSGSQYDTVAVRVDSYPTLNKMLCDSGANGCPSCLPQYPPNQSAACINNRCQVQTAL